MKKPLICFILIFFFILTGCSHKSDQNLIKVMTLNVRYDNPLDSLNSWNNRILLVCNFIIKEKPDILGMQEVLLRQYEALDSSLTEYSSIGIGRDDGAREGEMSPIFYKKERFDIVRTITFWLSDTPGVPGSKGWGASLPRIVTWLELVNKINHQHFFFFNTHFASDSDSARIMSSKMLLKEIEKISDGFPSIITGDFNMSPASKGYTILTGPYESVPFLKDSYFISEKIPSGPAYTFNGFSDKPGAGRVDYIFVKSGMKVLEQSTIIKKEKGIFISDHWPVEAIVSIKYKNN